MQRVRIEPKATDAYHTAMIYVSEWTATISHQVASLQLQL